MITVFSQEESQECPEFKRLAVALWSGTPLFLSQIRPFYEAAPKSTVKKEPHFLFQKFYGRTGNFYVHARKFYGRKR